MPQCYLRFTIPGQKGNDFLLGLLLFLSFHQHAAACQNWFCRAEQEWGEKTDRRILFWEKQSKGTVCNELQGKNDKNLNTGCSFRFRNVCWLHFIELQLIWVIWREGAIGGSASMLCLNSLALGSLFVLLGSSFGVTAVFECKWFSAQICL